MIFIFFPVFLLFLIRDCKNRNHLDQLFPPPHLHFSYLINESLFGCLAVGSAASQVALVVVPVSAGDIGGVGPIPWVREGPWREGMATHSHTVFRDSMEKSLAGYIPRVARSAHD